MIDEATKPTESAKKTIHMVEAMMFLEKLTNRFGRYLMTCSDVAAYAGVSVYDIKLVLIENGLIKKNQFHKGKMSRYEITAKGRAFGLSSRKFFEVHVGSMYLPLKSAGKLLDLIADKLETND